MAGVGGRWRTGADGGVAGAPPFPIADQATPIAGASLGGSRHARRGRRCACANGGVAGARAAGRFHVVAGGYTGADGAPIPSPSQTNRLRWVEINVSAGG
jgi:hypothetical protein